MTFPVEGLPNLNREDFLMGGYSPKCETTTWRGVRVCKHSVPKLNAWAAATGSAFYVHPIQGCYSTAVAASTGTHAGGGVYDVECDGYALSVREAAVNAGRKVGLVTFGRWWSGNLHIHLLDPACPTMSPEAVGQMGQFRRGETGMVGPGDVDTWDRSTVGAIMRAFDNRFSSSAPAPAPAPAGARTYTIPKGGTLGKAAIALGVSVGVLAAFNGIPNPDVVRPGQVVTAPPSGYKAPAPKPSAAKPAPAKPAPKPVAKPKPVLKAKSSLPAFVIPGQRGVYASYLYEGKHRSTSVYRYEQALRARLGAKKANALGLTAARAADGYYGTATSAATKAAYRQLGVTPNATRPGPYLLRVLHLGVIR